MYLNFDFHFSFDETIFFQNTDFCIFKAEKYIKIFVIINKINIKILLSE